MRLIQRCPVPDALLNAWTHLLVSEAAPFFLTPTLLPYLPKETLLLRRDEFKKAFFALSNVDSYKTYRVHADGAWVAWLTPGEFDSISPTVRAMLLYAQWQLGRGQVYDVDAIRPFLQESDLLSTAESRVVETPDGAKLILDTTLWMSLPVDVQRKWLMQFVLEDQPSYDTLDPDDVPWNDLAFPQRAVVQTLVNSFAPQSGPNCFATALAAITSEHATAHTIANTWLHYPPFFRGLSERGYRQRGHLDGETHHIQDAVLVWFDQAGTPQHACYVLGNDIALNKNSQCWYTPRRLVSLPALLNEWSDEPYDLMLYQREH